MAKKIWCWACRPGCAGTSTGAGDGCERDRTPSCKPTCLQIAEMNEWLVENPPRTLREACQFLAWFQSVDRMWAAGGALGQLDELLRPYYEARPWQPGITDDEAGHLAHRQPVHQRHPLFADRRPGPDGHDLTSPMSYLILEAVHRLRIPINLAMRVHDQLDPQLLRQAVEYHLRMAPGRVFRCSGGLDKGFARNGFPLPLARMRAKVGCNWTALPGDRIFAAGCHPPMPDPAVADRPGRDDGGPGRSAHDGGTLGALCAPPGHLDRPDERRLRLAHGAPGRATSRRSCSTCSAMGRWSAGWMWRKAAWISSTSPWTG